MLRKTICLGMLAVALLLASAAPAPAIQTLQLDTRVVLGSKPDVAGPVTTAQPLAAGQTYFAVITGTASIWRPSLWAEHGTPGPCGTPENAPLTPSPGVTNGPVGLDAETVFAIPPRIMFQDFKCGTQPFPFDTILHTTGALQIDVGNGFSHTEPLGGPYNTPRSDHTYTYQLTGTGAPVSFRFMDFPLADNYGVFTMQVLTAAECAAVSCNGSPMTPATTTTAAGGVAGSHVVQAPQSVTCKSRRHFIVHFFVRHGVKIAQVVVFVNGHLIGRAMGTPTVRTPLDLRGLPRGAFVLDMRGVSSRGVLFADERRYHTCVVKIISHRRDFHAHRVHR